MKFDSSLILEVCFTTGNLAFLRLEFDSTTKYLDLIEILRKNMPMAPDVVYLR